MTIQTHDDTLRISGLSALDEAQSDDVTNQICAALRPDTRVIEFDLSQLRALDCSGACVLMAVYNALSRSGARFAWRVRNPAPAVRQLLELVRLHRLFEIAPPRLSRLAL